MYTVLQIRSTNSFFFSDMSSGGYSSESEVESGDEVELDDDDDQVESDDDGSVLEEPQTSSSERATLYEAVVFPERSANNRPLTEKDKSKIMKDHIENSWKYESSSRVTENFVWNTDIHLGCAGGGTLPTNEFEAFKKFMTDDIVDIIVEATNANISSKGISGDGKKWARPHKLCWARKICGNLWQLGFS